MAILEAAIKKPKLEFYVLLAVILVAVFFRFFMIRNYVVFLGDEGRDMIIMRKIFTEKQLPFLGPTASVGGFYLGPIYYWMAAPFLLLFGFDPVGPAYFVAIVGVATVFLLYKILKETIGFWPAILASFLYSTAPLIVRYSRSSWNPNPLPFFSLLLIYFLYLGISNKRLLYFLLAGACFGIAIQLHYLATILLAISALIIIIHTNFRKWPFILAASTAGFLVTFSPFLIFELRHGFPNFKTISEFVTRGSTVGFKTNNYIWLVSNLGNIFIEEISKIQDTLVTKIYFWFLAFGSVTGLIKNWFEPKKRLIFSITIIWFIGGLLGLRFYAGQVFDYYFGLILPAPFLLSGLIFALFWQRPILRIIPVSIVIITAVFFLSKGFYVNKPNKLIDQTERVSSFVIEKTEGRPYNFALISESNSDHAYRYFLEIKDRKPSDLETLITDQLLVVCESKTCAPLGHPIWEIAGFGRAEIVGDWQLPDIGIKVLRLTHWPGAPSPAGKPAVKGT